MSKKRNADKDVQALRKRLAKDPSNREALRGVIAALVRLNDHRGLVSLGAPAIPYLREAEEALPPPDPSGPDAPPLVRKARLDLVRLELSILGHGAWVSASPLRSSEPPSYWISTGEIRRTRSGEDGIAAYPSGGGPGALIPLQDVVRVGDDATAERETQVGPWRIAKLGFDGGKLGDDWVEAWLRGDELNGADTWNGWASPFMTLAQLRVFVDRWARFAGAVDALRLELREQPDGVVLVATQPGDPETVIEPEWPKGPGVPGEPLWNVGLGFAWLEERQPAPSSPPVVGAQDDGQ